MNFFMEIYKKIRINNESFINFYEVIDFIIEVEVQFSSISG